MEFCGGKHYPLHLKLQFGREKVTNKRMEEIFIFEDDNFILFLIEQCQWGRV